MYEKGKRDATGETALAAESILKKRPAPKEVEKKKFYDADYAYRSTILMIVTTTNGMWIQGQPNT